MESRGRSFLLMLVVFVVLAHLQPAVKAPFVALSVNFVLYVIAWHVAVLAHEVAHAVTARAVGLRPFAIDVGYGRPLVQTVIAGLSLVVRRFPSGGFAAMAAYNTYLTRWRSLAAIAAGPLCSIALATGCVLLGHAHVGITDQLARKPLPLSMFLVANTFGAISLLPIPIRARGQQGPSAPNGTDGWIMFMLCAGRIEEQVRRLVDANDWADAHIAYVEKRWGDVRSACQRVLARSPGEPSATLLLGAAALGERDYPEARDAFASLLDHPGAAAFRYIVRNNLAWTYFMLGDSARMEEASRLSEQALRDKPYSPNCLATRGAILVELGQMREGDELLRRARAECERPDRASIECLLAMASAGLGRIESARRHLRDAERLDRTCALLPRARKACGESGAHEALPARNPRARWAAWVGGALIVLAGVVVLVIVAMQMIVSGEAVNLDRTRPPASAR